MNKLSSALREIDLHMVLLLLIVVPLALVLSMSLPWAVLGVALFPQGILLTRALVDYPVFKRPAGAYLVANETFVVLLFLSCWALSRWLRDA